MAGPLDARLTEPTSAAAGLAAGRVRVADPTLPRAGRLPFAKNFGHDMARWTVALFGHDVQWLPDAAQRLGMTLASTRPLLREDLPLVVAFCGQPPSQLTEEALHALAEAITTTTRLTGPMRRRRRAGLFGLRRLLFEARILDRPPVHRREGGTATRRARLVGAGTRDPPDDPGLPGSPLGGAAAQDHREAHQGLDDLRRVPIGTVPAAAEVVAAP